MSTEQLLVYLFLGAIALLQFLAGVRKRRRAEADGGWEAEPAAEQHLEQPWEPSPELPRPEVSPQAVPRPAAPPARMAGTLAPSSRPQAERAPRLVPRPRAAGEGAIIPGDRAQLRRAFELMAILGPPRSLAPHEH